MKKKNTEKKIFSFHSISAPCDFSARIKEEAVHSNLKMGQTENGFDLQIGSNHAGKIVYRAKVSADENGSSFISGEITTIPWNSSPDNKKNLFQKIISVFGYIVFLPFVLIFLLCYGIYMLFLRLFHGKNSDPTEEEKLCDFMINKMCCKQKEQTRMTEKEKRDMGLLYNANYDAEPYSRRHFL